MRTIRLEGITKSYNNEPVLHEVSFSIPGGKFFALLGPSGCGKTTLLRLIGGFEHPDQGRIFLGDEDITDVPIHLRRVNTVFQNYALFPHLNVFENVAYSLKIKKEQPDIIYDKVIHILKTFRIEAHWKKPIGQLSGGQQQRVALARAVINEPEILLLDEPLAALDYSLREKMLIELIELQDKLKMTFIYVTHDQFEALTVADQMAIMNYNGLVEQIDTPQKIYEFPESAFVAQFVGTTNILGGYLTLDTSAYVTVPDLGKLHIMINPDRNFKSGDYILMSIRPEKILITKQVYTDFSNNLVGTVEAIVYHGRSTQFNVRLKNGQRLQVFRQNEEHFPPEIIDYDQEVNLYWQKDNVVVLSR